MAIYVFIFRLIFRFKLSSFCLSTTTFTLLLFKFLNFHSNFQVFADSNFHASAFQVSTFPFQLSSFYLSIPIFTLLLFRFLYFHFNFQVSACQFQFSRFYFSGFHIYIPTFKFLLFKFLHFHSN
jgi:hypothetical protein